MIKAPMLTLLSYAQQFCPNVLRDPELASRLREMYFAISDQY